MSAVIVEALRTPIGTAGHSLAARTADELGAAVLSRLASYVTARGGAVDEVILGNCMGPGGNLARVAALRAGLGYDVPALSVDRQCASGLAAITLVSPGPGAILAGGVESASTAPWRLWPPRDGRDPVRYERAPFAHPPTDDPEMGLANDLLAAEHQVSRAAQDDYAARSHARAVATGARGGFDEEIVGVGGVTRDDRPKPGLTAARLARFPAAFREGGTVTAGNSCGISDGAAAVAVVGEETRRAWGSPGLRILATATTASDPKRPGGALVPAVRAALKGAGVGLDRIDVVEFNEAFAGQMLACAGALGLDPERVCPEGGALALGHPWGASGAVLVVRLFTQLVRRGRGDLGLAAIAAGGGQGVAMVVERVEAA